MSWGAAIAAGIQAVGARRSTNKANRHNIFMRQLAREQFEWQKDWNENFIQKRVADAQLAGIHPLFALGGNAGGVSPTASVGTVQQPSGDGGYGAAGAAIGGIVDALIARTNSETKSNEADAMLKDANRAAIENMFGSTQRDKTPAVAAVSPSTDPNDPMGTAEYFRPQHPKSGSRGTVAGQSPVMVEGMTPDGRKVELYNPDLGLDEIGQIKYAYERAIHKGADALMWLRNHGFFFKNPSDAYKNIPITEIRWKRKKRSRPYRRPAWANKW